LDLSTTCIHHSELLAITELSLIYTVYSSPLHTPQCSQSSLFVSWQRIYNSLTVTAAHIKSSFHSIIPFLPSLRLPSPETPSILITTAYYGTQLTQTIFVLFIILRHRPRRIHSLSVVKQACLPRHGIASVPALTTENTALLLLRVFASAGMCLPSRCPAMNYSGVMSQYYLEALSSSRSTHLCWHVCGTTYMQKGNAMRIRTRKVSYENTSGNVYSSLQHTEFPYMFFVIFHP
jgi:hypothetical protein